MQSIGAITGQTVSVLVGVDEQSASLPKTIEARVGRVAPHLTGAGNMLQLFAKIADPTVRKTLKAGQRLRALANTEQLRNDYRLPLAALFGEQIVYVVDQGVLQKRLVSVRARNLDYVYVQQGLEVDSEPSLLPSLQPGEQILITPLRRAVGGLKVRAIKARKLCRR